MGLGGSGGFLGIETGGGGGTGGVSESGAVGGGMRFVLLLSLHCLKDARCACLLRDALLSLSM